MSAQNKIFKEGTITKLRKSVPQRAVSSYNIHIPFLSPCVSCSVQQGIDVYTVIVASWLVFCSGSFVSSRICRASREQPALSV